MSNRTLSYKELLAHDGQDTILLSTKKGEIGYRIKKLELFANTPGANSYEHVMKVFSKEQSGVDGDVDFSDSTLLGVAFLEGNNSNQYTDQLNVVFDNITFNQDIYITHTDVGGSSPCNYYLELEMTKLDESQAMVATLKDIRNNS